MSATIITLPVVRIERYDDEAPSPVGFHAVTLQMELSDDAWARLCGAAHLVGLSVDEVCAAILEETARKSLE